MNKKIIAIGMASLFALVTFSSLSVAEQTYSESETGVVNADLITVEVYVKDRQGEPINRATVTLTYGILPFVKQDVGVTDRNGCCNFEGDYEKPGGLLIASFKVGYYQASKTLYDVESGKYYREDLTLKKVGESHSRTVLFERFPLLQRLLTL